MSWNMIENTRLADPGTIFSTRFFILLEKPISFHLGKLRKVMQNLPVIRDSNYKGHFTFEKIFDPITRSNETGAYQMDLVQNLTHEKDKMDVDFSMCQQIQAESDGGEFEGSSISVKYDPDCALAIQFCAERGWTLRHEKSVKRKPVTYDAAAGQATNELYNKYIEEVRARGSSMNRKNDAAFFRNRMLLSNLNDQVRIKDIKSLFLSLNLIKQLQETTKVVVFVDNIYNPNNRKQDLGAFLVDIIVPYKKKEKELDMQAVVNLVDGNFINGCQIKCELDQYNQKALEWMQEYNRENGTEYVMKFGPPPKGIMIVAESEERANELLFKRENRERKRTEFNTEHEFKRGMRKREAEGPGGHPFGKMQKGMPNTSGNSNGWMQQPTFGQPPAMQNPMMGMPQQAAPFGSMQPMAPPVQQMMPPQQQMMQPAMAQPVQQHMPMQNMAPSGQPVSSSGNNPVSDQVIDGLAAHFGVDKKVVALFKAMGELSKN